MAANIENDVPSSVDLQAFEPEPPTYDNAFPSLGGEARQQKANETFGQGAWQPKFRTNNVKCTQVD